MRGLIVKAVGGLYTVAGDGKRHVCTPRGLFRKNGESPLVGDLVEFMPASPETGEDRGRLLAILPRRNRFTRPPLANIDALLLVSAAADPRPNLFVLDELIAVAEQKTVTPVLVLNKCELGNTEPFLAIYRSAGFPVFPLSCITGEGVEELRAALPEGITALCGNSGVGKSSLLNRLLPGLSLPTGEVSAKLGRGRHTTRATELFELEAECWLADTPGFSSVSFLRYEPLRKENLQNLFREFAPFLGACRFDGCAHIREPDCAVRGAVEVGAIPPSRYESYCALYGQAAAVREWERTK